MQGTARRGLGVIAACLVAAGGLGLYARSAGAVTTRVNSVMLFSGVIGLGVSLLVLSGRLGTLERGDRALAYAMSLVAVGVLMLTDVARLMSGEVYVSVPFAVAAAIAIVRYVRRW